LPSDAPVDDSADRPEDRRPGLLLVEDDRLLVPLLIEVLGADYRVDHAPDGQAGLHLGLSRQYDLIVLDRGLPAIDGIDLLGRLRGRGVMAPVLILTARGLVADKVEGLDAGAEDYLVKPFEIDELLARLRALRRRHSDETPVLTIGDRRLDVQGRRVTGPHAEPVELSGRESQLLAVLARRPGRVFSRPELLDAVFDADDGPGIVDTYVYYLRRKLGKDIVRTVHGAGYRIGS
jgi:two-component system, OmpR family, response regulator QseB